MKNLILSVFLATAGMAIASDNAPVGIRPMSDNVQKEWNAAKESEEAAGSDDAAIQNAAEQTAGCFSCDDSFIYYPNYGHQVVALCAFGDSVGIEDGSIWQVKPFDTDLVQTWRPDDVVTITQNHSWFTSYQYRIDNKNNGTSIASNLSQGPMIFGEHSLQITNIDHYNGVVVLSDHSQWFISSLDRFLFMEWFLGDYIILGVNSGWDSSCPYLLINSNMNNHLRAKQY
jgi:hypothetical protein